MSVLGVIATHRPGLAHDARPGAADDHDHAEVHPAEAAADRRGFHGSWLEEQMNREQGAPAQHVMCEACDQKAP